MAVVFGGEAKTSHSSFEQANQGFEKDQIIKEIKILREEFTGDELSELEMPNSEELEQQFFDSRS